MKYYVGAITEYCSEYEFTTSFKFKSDNPEVFMCRMEKGWRMPTPNVRVESSGYKEISEYLFRMAIPFVDDLTNLI